MTESNQVILRPDAKGRISLKDIMSHMVSSYKVTLNEEGIITLEPHVEIPLSHKWIFDNKDLLEKMKQQLQKEDKASPL